MSGAGSRQPDRTKTGENAVTAADVPAPAPLTPSSEGRGSAYQFGEAPQDSSQSTPAPLMIWNYDHPRRGSCLNKSCPSYGMCHCGCRSFTSWSNKSDRSKFLVKDRPCVFKSGHAGAMARRPDGAITPTCGHPEGTHKARGMCKHCYDSWFKKNSQHAKKYHTKISPERLAWERKRYNRFSSLLWKHGYENIRVVLKELDREVPEDQEAEVAS